MWTLVIRPWVLAVATVFVACREPLPEGTTDAPAIFAAYCATCHGPTGKPDAATVARTNVKDLTNPKVRAKLTPEAVAQQIRNGSENRLMPSFTSLLTEAQIKAVAEWVASDAFVAPR